MRRKNRETLKEAIGIIEGISYAVGEKAQEALAFAGELLEEVLRDENKGEETE